MKSDGLGRGLAALIPDKIKKDLEKKAKINQDNSIPEDMNIGVIEIEIERIVPNTNQPRKNFDKEQLELLADSIKQYGLLQPISVIDTENGIFEIVAGERRFRAAKIAGLKTIPAIIKNADDVSKLEIALVENIQRTNLNPIEEALAYQKLIQEYDLNQEQISQKVNKGRSSITNLLRYLRLPEEIQQGLMEGKINEGHAKVLAALDNPEAQITLYRKAVKDSLTVRNVETIAQEINVKSHKRKIRSRLNPIMTQREKILSDSFGLKVQIKPGAKGGKVLVEYYTEDDIDRIIQMLAENED